MTDSRLIADVKAAEGCRLIAYKDTLGFWTIGYGHKLQVGIDWEGHEITQETADELLSQDLDTADEQAQNLPEIAGLNICRTNAIIELVYNMGLTTWHGFPKCRAAIAAGQWGNAANELQYSKWAKQVGPTRSGRLVGYIFRGTYA